MTSFMGGNGGRWSVPRKPCVPFPTCGHRHGTSLMLSLSCFGSSKSSLYRSLNATTGHQVFSLMCGANCFLRAKVLQFDSSHSYQATMSSSTNVSGSGTSYLYEFAVKPRRRFLAGVSASRGWYKAVNACVSIDIACPGSGIGPTAQMPKLSHFHAPAGGLYSAWIQHRCISTPR